MFGVVLTIVPLQFPSPFLMHRQPIYPSYHRPRSRPVQYRSMKQHNAFVTKEKSMTLTPQMSASVISPTHSRSWRKSFMGGGPNSPPPQSSSVSSPKGMDISGPIMDSQPYDWDKKKKSGTRTTRRLKSPKYSPTKGPSMPAVSFSESKVCAFFFFQLNNNNNNNQMLFLEFVKIRFFVYLSSRKSHLHLKSIVEVRIPIEYL